MSESMSRGYAHVVQLRLTHEEWRVVSELAQLRRVSVEDLLREGLRLSHGETQEPAAERAAHLRLLTPGPGSHGNQPR